MKKIIKNLVEKKIITYKIFLTVLVLPILSYSQNWQLVWSDEFLGSEVNKENWIHEVGGHGWGNNELQFYTDRIENSYIENGNLIIEAKLENYGGKSYTSARLITQNKQSFQYGRAEARIKLPYGQGIWPAFWMLGDSFSSIGWPACGEIDIMEMVGGTNSDNVIYGTVHWEHNGGHAEYGGNYVLSSGIYADNYHLFSIEWTPEYIKWFMDGHQYHVISITDQQLSEFHQKFFFLLNIAVGGNWPGPPDGTTTFPQKMYVDYIRFYADANEIPDISIVSPIDNAVLDPFSDVNIRTDIDFDGDIEIVEFYQDAMKIGQTEVKPYEMNWHNISPGCYDITVTARGTNGYLGTSQKTTLQIGDDCVEAPYFGKPFMVPGEIEVENFNIGEANQAFYDSDVLNHGGKYRLSDQVDIELCEDDYGGYNVGWIESGEWLNYFIDVESTSTYDFSFRVASENGEGSLHIEIDGLDVTGAISVPVTGGWQTWNTVSFSGINLSKGMHILKVVFETGGFNFNRIEIYEPNTEPIIEVIYPNGGETFEKETIEEIRWNSLKIRNVVIGFSSNGGTNWDFISRSEPSLYGSYRWKVPDVNSDNCLIMIVDEDNSSIRATSDSPFKIDIVNTIETLNKSPNNYELFQNYPNPFNPSTTIKYSISEAGQVLLKIYDILGNEISELVNEFQPPGNYSVNFNLTSFEKTLTSGIYIYRLKAGGYEKIKKAVFIK